MPRATESHVAVKGGRLHAREIGTGQPIIVLHGGPDFDHRYLLPESSAASARALRGRPQSQTRITRIKEPLFYLSALNRASPRRKLFPFSNAEIRRPHLSLPERDTCTLIFRKVVHGSRLYLEPGPGSTRTQT